MTMNGSVAPQPVQVETQGGAYVAGSVSLDSGDFIGRDKIINNIASFIQSLSAVDEAEKARSFDQQHFIEGVRNYVNRLQAMVVELADSSRGEIYKGLLAYRFGDTEIFCGREQALHALSGKLQHSLTILHSQSGAGKTSLLQAGLTPRLIGKRSLAIYVRPYDLSPSLAIKRVFFPNLKEMPAQTEAPLRSFLRQVTDVFGLDTTLYILLDQFEEFFTLVGEAERHAFVRELADCLNDETLKVRWLVALRSEFFSDMAYFRPEIDNPFANEYRLNRLTPAEAKRVIIAPAARQHIVFEPELVERLLTELRDDKGEIAPPQIQLICQALLATALEQQETTPDSAPDAGHLIRLTVYDKQGGAAGILRGYLNQVLTRELPTKAERDLARQLMISLVSSDKRRTRCTYTELANTLAPYLTHSSDLATLLDRLVKSRLLNVERDAETDEPSYELVHDYLLDEIEIDPEVQAQKAAQELLTQEVKTFSRFGTLLSADTFKIIDSQHKYLVVDDQAKQLLRLSQTQHEAAQAHELKLVKDRLRQTILAAVAGVAALVLAVVVGVVWLGQLNASATSFVNDSRRLANIAVQALMKDPLESIQVSLGALPNAASPRPYVAEAEFTLTQGLHASLARRVRQFVPASLTVGQVALGPERIAVGGADLHLLSYDLSQVITLTRPTESMRTVAWNRDGKTWLSYGNLSVLIWRDEKQIAEQQFFEGVIAARWRPDHPQVVVCSGNTVQLWSYAANRLTELLKFPASCKDVLWSPDGRWLAAWGEKTALQLWDSVTDQRFHLTESPQPGPIHSVAWSPDSLHLVAESGDATLQIWTTTNPTRPQPFVVADHVTIDRVEFVDNTRFVSFGLGDMARLWSVDGKPIFQFGVPKDYAQDVLISPDKMTLLTLSNNGLASLFDLASGKLETNFQGHTKRILAAAWHHHYLATSSADGTVRIWRTPSAAEKLDSANELMTLRGHTGAVLDVRWLSDQTLLTYGADGTFRIWDVFDPQGLPLCNGIDGDGYPRCYNLSRAFTGEGAALSAASWLDDDTIITLDRDTVARRITVSTGATQVLTATSAEFSAAVVSPRGQRVLFYAKNGNGQVQDFTKGKPVAITGPIAIAFWLTPDSLLISQETGEARLVNPETGTILAPLKGHQGKITAAQRFGDEQFATAEENGVLHIWNLKTGQEIKPIKDNQPLDAQTNVSELHWSRDGKRLLAAGQKVALWDIEKGEKIWGLQDSAEVAHVNFSRDEQLVGVTMNTKFFVVTADTGKQVGKIQEYTQPVRGIQWVAGGHWLHQEPYWGIFGGLQRLVVGEQWRIPDERLLLLTWSGDGTARLSDWENQTEILRMNGMNGTDRIIAAAVNEAGSHILTAGGQSGVLRVWEAWPRRSDELLAKAHAYLNQVSK